MKRFVAALAAAVAIASAACQSPTPGLAGTPVSAEMAAWRQRAAGVTIVRDDWGIPHVRARTDADAIFGMLYAQAEDDFARIETNFINSLGRLAEAEGDAEIYRDLRMKLFIDPEVLKAEYRKAPEWLRRDMDAWADGLNFFLATHPDVRPRVITAFEPWMALSFSEGSIGGDIEQVSIEGLQGLYGRDAIARAADARRRSAAEPLVEPTGSNGFALGPANTASGKAMLWINPHTSFFFRHEAQVTSDEGLNVYGASTWGQFFVYQGFNARAGWMHTSSGVDNIDEYALTTIGRPDGIYYRFGREERQLTTKVITVPYRTPSGMRSRDFTVYYSHHGPVVREADGRWIAVRMMNEPLKALTQSFTRTKARNLQEFRDSLEWHTNSSNNTVYADADGNFAYFHANFVPRRDTRFDWRRPVDGSDPRTEWGPIHSIDDSPNNINPKHGWVYNTNNWPYTSSGDESPKQNDYPSYFDGVGENPRGIHAVRVLSGLRTATHDALIQAGFDTYQPEFALLIPRLVKAFDALPTASARRAALDDAMALLRRWDYRWSVASVANTIAVFWGEDLWTRVAPEASRAGVSTYEFMETRATGDQLLTSLEAAVGRITTDFGRWNTPWGEVNRFQRISPALVHPFDDSRPSIPVGFPSARWGSLASFGARPLPHTKKWYGTTGNSFVASVEFGDKVSARAITAGGLSSDIASKHFNDQADRYATGNLREVYFYPEQLQGHTERTYMPGE